MKGFEQVTMTDHEFAKYLREKDPKWTSSFLGNSNSFRDSNGKLLAVAIYDNVGCKRRLFLPKEEK